jgi:hypothetical protein
LNIICRHLSQDVLWQAWPYKNYIPLNLTNPTEKDLRLEVAVFYYQIEV